MKLFPEIFSFLRIATSYQSARTKLQIVSSGESFYELLLAFLG